MRSSSLWPLALPLLLGAGCFARGGTIGSILKQKNDGHVYVVEVPPELGAAQAGLQPGDEILLIEGQDVRAMSPQELHEALSGEEGETVNLTVLRGDEVHRLRVVRTARPLTQSTKPD